MSENNINNNNNNNGVSSNNKNNPKVCVVSLMGKSSYLPNESKSWKLNSLLKKYIFKDINLNLNKSTNLNNNDTFNDTNTTTTTTETTTTPITAISSTTATNTTSSSNDSTNENDNISGNKKTKSESKSEDNEDETNETNDDLNDDDDINIETYYDYVNQVIYLNLESIYDTNNIINNVLNQYDVNQQHNLPKAKPTNTNTNTSNSDNGSEDNFYKLWQNEQIKYVKATLLLFSLSHIIIISSPNIEFDIGYVRFFRIIDTLRIKVSPSIIELIKLLNIQISNQWLYAARPCSPRVLFTFENCPNDILNDPDNKLSKLQDYLEHQIFNSLRKSYVITNISNNSLFALPANQEFVYIHRNRSTKLTTNDINKYLLNNLHKSTLPTSSLTTATTPTSIQLTQQLYTNTAKHSYQANRQQQQQQQPSFSNNQTDNKNNKESDDSILFRKFVYEHINMALNGGFNDNIGRNNIQPVFELARVNNWYKLYDGLYKAFFTSSTNNIELNNTQNSLKQLINIKTKLRQHFKQILTNIDIDAQFSQNRCKKVLPIALSAYKDNLPPHYTSQHHKHKLEKAINIYSLQARGPMYKKYLDKLKLECSNIWKSGKQLCEAKSLNGNPCINELHRVKRNKIRINECDNQKEEICAASDDGENNDSDFIYDNENDLINDDALKSNQNLLIKSHNSAVRTIATSNCGFYQKERADPFYLVDANYAFYKSFLNDLSYTNKIMLKYEFPIFKPSSKSKPTYSSDKLKDNKSNNNKNNNNNNDNENLSNLSITNLSQQQDNNDVVSDEPDQERQQQQPEQEQQQQQQQQRSDGENNTVADEDLLSNGVNSLLLNDLTTLKQTTTTTTTNNEKLLRLVSQQLVSTTVYLRGMTHSDCQPGLLPRFSSWSLCSIGKFSDYNIHTGIQQIGFLPGHNFLLPYDIYTHHDKHDRKKLTSSSSSSLKHVSSNKKLSKESLSKDVRETSSIRFYMGMEYECCLGHRFICSGPDRLVKLASNGNVKDDANKLINGDMPLYTACPCRNGKDLPSYMAQMMRVFIVTPQINESNSLHIILQPKIQPNPQPCPIFKPSYDGPIKLTENSIWVLRLPYIYMGDDGPYYKPKDFETLNNCRVLKGMVSWI